MRRYQVIFEEPGVWAWQAFMCMADSPDHAEEQTLNAYPNARILWVSENDSDEINFEVMEK